MIPQFRLSLCLWIWIMDQVTFLFPSSLICNTRNGTSLFAIGVSTVMLTTLVMSVISIVRTSLTLRNII